jgi:hypothetical protein
MNKANRHPFTESGICDYFLENIGRRFICVAMAKTFKTTSEEMRTMLLKLVSDNFIEMVSTGRNKLFLIRSEAERRALANHELPEIKREYRQDGPAWDTVRARLIEFREAKSLIRSAP